MPLFSYTALTANGKTVTGTVDAENARVARQRLRSQGVFPTDVHESAGKKNLASTDISRFLGNRVSNKELMIVTRQFATLVQAGLPLVSSLNALVEQNDSPAVKRVLVEVREKVEGGSPLAKAMGDYPKVFPQLYVNMVASGEASGTLDKVLANLADYLEAQGELKRKVSGALLYPSVVLIVCILVVAALLMFVVPQIIEIFERQGRQLPWPTQITLGISNFLRSYFWLVFIGLGAAWYGVQAYYESDTGRRKIDRIFLKLPAIGSLYLTVNTARIAKTLSALLGSGVGLLTALEITRSLMSNIHLAEALDVAREGVREGKSLARELQRTGVFPPMLCHMVALGETSGELESMLDRIGTAYENEVKSALSAMTSLLEVGLIVGVGGIVLFIVISILYPITELIDLVQK